MVEGHKIDVATAASNFGKRQMVPLIVPKGMCQAIVNETHIGWLFFEVHEVLPLYSLFEQNIVRLKVTMDEALSV